ncbi:MAG: hypothetical protein NWQ55_03255 [Salibacteraceae bacterium]|nr:hypothetical protein [Salibacteraceae bacterium]
MKTLSQFFYQKSSVLLALLLTAVSFAYLFLVLKGKALGFELEAGAERSLGTQFGFQAADVLDFFSARTHEMINAYIDFNQIWDTIFALTYGLMYVAWVSVLFKPFSAKASLINLFPLAQVVFDWLENFQLASLANQFLANGDISTSQAQAASVFSMIKWACSGLTFILLLVGIILAIARAIRKRKA